ncbi:hypothetical protein [Paenibacillus prosopidis]|uniref:Uncharacterized protein n=1 Tax=Paenibacillus prosopidis TaxID=630520 RepID=A0A368VLN5_9BACL|nr:hypothetical protein [Paenibacillus prosopidis]RCW41606.1 hypothetical protein DFP97_12242 [Paenibacillus prosopidis]
MFNTIINQLNTEIQKAKLSSWPDQEQIEKATTKKREVSRLWKKFGTDPLVLDMQKVVLKVVKAYHMDFYELDLSRLEQIGEVPFCWFVRNHGTDLLPLEGDERTIRNAESWFDAIRMQFTDGTNVKDSQQLYICDPKAKTMKRLKVFSSVQFRVTSVTAHV